MNMLSEPTTLHAIDSPRQSLSVEEHSSFQLSFIEHTFSTLEEKGCLQISSSFQLLQEELWLERENSREVSVLNNGSPFHPEPSKGGIFGGGKAPADCRPPASKPAELACRTLWQSR